MAKELVLIGGHPKDDGEILAYLAERAKGEGEIGYIDFASSDSAEKTRRKAEAFQSHGVKLRVIRTVDDCYGLSVILMGGGDQEKLVRELKQTGIDSLVRPFWKKGEVLLAGSSAGAMALFWDMLPDGADVRGETDLVQGMGPMGGGIVMPHWNMVDEHYKEKLEEVHGEMLILGIDEDTALRWRNGVCDVLGAGSVEFRGRTRGIWHASEEFDLSSAK
jgi:cyanophycinase-like exopeptidase